MKIKLEENLDRDDGMETNSDGDADSDDYEDDITANGPSAKAFYMPTTSKPSARTPSFNYRWRGELRQKKVNPESTGSGGIEYKSDAILHNITFMEPKGTKLTGTFGGEDWGEFKFTGVKIGFGDKDPPCRDGRYSYAFRREEIFTLYTQWWQRSKGALSDSESD
ncbi:hypothetical protein BTUL_0126g00210 [Botrytis tulipae]|uniref:Uncharacterized protein n=1 Tax=Botrytis tulipae TaxID=87230 RepID=A0A4Z1EP03_9HELO|nr:hypothetical protein BTUL_0126g00210 [Botrytis tulipae]